MNISSLRLPQRAATWWCLAAVPLLTSCTAPVLRHQFTNYNEAYADALNQQMLLNLARLENGHPAYYLALGSILNRYTYSSQANAGNSSQITDSRTTTDNTPSGRVNQPSFPLNVLQHVSQSIFGYSVGGTVSGSSNPEFQFIPINNETAARQVLEPISTDVFLQLYQQGYPIDQLLRVMIERVETPLVISSNRLILVNSPYRGTAERYGRFLRACGMLRDLQQHGFLTLEGSTERDPLGPVAVGATAAEHNASPSLKDYVDAEDKGLVFSTNASGGWELSKKRPVPRFVLRGEWQHEPNNPARMEKHGPPSLTPFADEVIQFLMTNRVVIAGTTNKELLAPKEYIQDDYEAITNLVEALNAGITIQAGVNTGTEGITRLVLRSFNRAMDAVATEQAGFDDLLNGDPEFRRMVPAVERRPILQMQWPAGTKGLEPPLQKVHYAGKTYLITDLQTDPLNPTEKWNRDVFRLMAELASQVTVDISKFQRQILELLP